MFVYFFVKARGLTIVKGAVFADTTYFYDRQIKGAFTLEIVENTILTVYSTLSCKFANINLR